MRTILLNSNRSAARSLFHLLIVLNTMAVSAATLHVWRDSSNPIAPFSNWATAAHTVQDAVDAATAGDEIVVTNGVYASGERAVHGLMTNRVVVDKAVIVRSVNGPEVTVIEGYQVPGTIRGDGAIRCVFLTNRAVLSGFTLTNGATRNPGRSIPLQETHGGGVYCEAALVTNCVLAGNAAVWGGGAYGGRLEQCTLAGNSAYKGGGAVEATLNRCTLTGNRAGEGGGTSMCQLANCVLWGNTANNGGGACCGDLNNCTLVANEADYGGGAGYATMLRNCIVYHNTLKKLAGDEDASNSEHSNHGGATLNFCCSTPMPTNGTANITNEPRFVNPAAGNLRLQPNSPCVDAGDNAYVSSPTDRDGRPRIIGRSVDMGAYEF